MTAGHIVFICSRLDMPGGSERAVVQTANLLSLKGHRVSLLILDETDKVFFPVDRSVQIFSAPLHFGNVEKGNVLTRKLDFRKHVRQLRNLLSEIKADIVIATEYHLSIASYLAGRKLDCKIYSWEHHHFNELDKSRFWNYLLHRIYPRLHGVICLNEDEARIARSIGAKAIVIPNFIEQHQPGNQTKTILTVARLTEVKGIDLLLEVAKPLLKEHPGWKWKIIGDGEMKERIVYAIQHDKMEDQVIIQQPSSDDLSKEYGESSIYVMTSRNECFPMVLLEAMSYGVPCVAFDCETGPRHIIQNEVDGFLIDDESIEEMIKAIEVLISDIEKRNRFGLNAFENVRRFSPEKIYGLWKQLLAPH